MQRTALDEADFVRFHTRTAPKLRAWLARVSGDPALADDLMQDAFLRLLQAGVDLRDEPRATGWLYRTAIHLFYDQARRSRREQPLGDAEPLAAGREHCGDVARLFARLPGRQRALLWLAYVEGCDHREIAARMGMAALSVRVLLFRARKRFSVLLEEGGYHG